MSVEVTVVDEEIEVLAAGDGSVIDVVAADASLLEVVVAEGEGDALVLDLEDAPDVEVVAAGDPEIEIVEQDSLPAVDHVIELIAGPQGPPGPPGMDTAGAIEEHVNAPEPHPAYDDIPDLALIFENGLVGP